MKTARIEGDLIISVEGGPLAGNLRPLDIRKDNNTWLVLCPDRETAYLAAEAAARAPELAAENERLKKVAFDQANNWQYAMDGWDAATKLAQERGERIIELEREAERLRALVIATATGIREVADLLAPTAPATAASLRHRADAAIEAAKEIRNA